MKFNKIAACFAAAACSVSMLSVIPVSAAESLTIAAGSAQAKAGETFTVDIKLASVPSTGVAGLDFGIKYDSSIFEVTSVTEGSVSKTSDKQIEGFSSNLETNVTAGKVSVLWATGQIKTSDSWIKSDGTLLTLNCKALKDGKSSVEIVAGGRAGATTVDAAVEGLKVVNPTVTAGTVNVGIPVTTTPQPPKVLYGDVNGDGIVDLADLLVLSQAVIHDITLTSQQKIPADCDGNGEVDISDLAKLKQFVMKDPITLGPKA